MTALIGSLPYTLTNGTTADANAVQANFAYIVSQVNANVQAAINAFIPADPDNTDYQTYLVWLDAGNEPDKVNQ